MHPPSKNKIQEETEGNGLDKKTFELALQIATKGNPFGFLLIKLSNPVELYSSFHKRIVKS